jgi:chemotaxis protein methyltransferase CheR
MRNVVDIAGPEDLAPGLSPALFKKFADLAYHHAGITLKTGKESLVSSRVRRRTVALKLTGPEAYLEFLEQDGSGREIVHFLDAISTNVTSFFREPEHFQMLAERFAEKKREGVRRMRFWSAASSSGEEPYTLAMLLAQHAARTPGFDFAILGTDISSRMLQHARRAVYDVERIEPVPQELRVKYLLRSRDRRRPQVRIAPELRRRVVFHPLNFMDRDYRVKDTFDVVFCRNVLIYFDKATQAEVVRRLARHLRPDGYLFVGHSESLAGLDVPFTARGNAVYRHTPSGGGR